MSTKQSYRKRYDAVIIGARCAGAATAMLLARTGASVLLVDRQAYASDTTSTHALMRAGVMQLARWGLLGRVIAAGTPQVRRTTFHYGAEAIPVTIKPEHGVDFLCAPRRTVLDRILVDAAVEAGAEVRHGVTLTGLETSPDGRVIAADLRDRDGDVTISADIVIGADGRQSMVAGLVGAPFNVLGKSCSGYVYGYYDGLPDDGYHWYFERRTAAGVIPTNGDRHCVFVGVPRERFAATFRKDVEAAFLRTAAANSLTLRAQLGTARLDGRLRPFAGAPGHIRQSYGPGWALVGDAGYFKDPLTAHGITDALRDAELLAQAVRGGGQHALAHYQAERDAISRDFFDVTETIASFDWSLAEVKQHHALLSEAMKAEARHVAGFSNPDPLAA